MALTVKQRGVLKGIIVGATMTFVVIVGAIVARPVVLSPEATVGERLSFALSADAFIALWLAISIGVLARHRFFTPEDIDGGGLAPGSETANILQATLQNTLEQTVLAVVVHLTWAILMPESWLSAIPAAVVLFLCGRLPRRCGVSGGGVCTYLLPICSDAHRRGRCCRMEGVLLELIALAAADGGINVPYRRVQRVNADVGPQ